MYSRETQKIGHGGFSEVYQAHSTVGFGEFAWKQLKDEIDNSGRERFRREVEVLATLDHKNIVGIVFADLLAPNPYFVMPKERRNLENAIKYDTARRLEIPRIFKEICEAVIYAHEYGVLHRDLKPTNVLLSKDDGVRVADFGLAGYTFPPQQGLTGVNDTGGSRPYAAPEQIDGSLGSSDERSDVFSLGKLLYFLYTHKDPVLLDSSDPNIPVGILEIIRTATDLDRARRHSSVKELLSSFWGAVTDEPPSSIGSSVYRPESTFNKRRFVGVQLKAQSLTRKLRGKSYFDDSELEQVAIKYHQLLWRERIFLWGDDDPDDPIGVIDPVAALKLLGFDVQRVSSLGSHSTQGKYFEIAGQIDQKNRVVSISDQFEPQVSRFTEAHELAHALLHRQEILHRDRPLDGVTGDFQGNKEEYQANRLATFFLMPEKLLRKEFKSRFKTEDFSISLESAAFLGHLNSEQLKKEIRNLRGLSRLLAGSKHYGHRSILSLSKRFGVSVEAMAIRLEELGLVCY